MRSNWKEPRTVPSKKMAKEASKARKKHKLRTRGRKRSGRVDEDGHQLREVPHGVHFIQRVDERYPDGEVRSLTLYRVDSADMRKQTGRALSITLEQYRTACRVRKISPVLASMPDGELSWWFLPLTEWRRLRSALAHHLEERLAKAKQRADAALTAAEFNARIESRNEPKEEPKEVSLFARVKGQKFSSFTALREALK